MSCYSIVGLALDVKATADEVEEALKAMKFNVSGIGMYQVECKCGTVLYRLDEKQPWKVRNSASFNQTEFKRQVARSKILAEAKRQGFDVVRDDTAGEKLVVKLRVR